MERYLQSTLENDALASRKMAFVSGPRQVGKTTLGKALVPERQSQFTWDEQSFRLAWTKNPLEALATRAGPRVLLDEIHKDRQWKSRLKGLYDVEGDSLQIVVTGSARLGIFRKGGDSLLGRFLPYALHPFTVGESRHPNAPDDIFRRCEKRFSVEDLLRLTGFPEPLLTGSEAKARRWSRLRLERLVQEDLRDLRAVRDVEAIRVLAELLPTKVGAPLSVNSLRENLSQAYATIQDWLGVLEALFVHFSVPPYSKKLSRMIQQERKIYLYDGLAISARGIRLENLTACHLRKACDFWTDAAFGDFRLHYLRNRDKQEVDFCVTRDGVPWMLVECKSSDTEVSPALEKFAAALGTTHNIQLVDKAGFRRSFPAKQRITVIDYGEFLSGLV